MISEKMQQMVNDMFDYLIDESSGLPKEDLIEPAILNFLDMYYHNEITKEDLLQVGEILECEFDMEVIDKEKEKRIRRKRLRKQERGIKKNG